MQQNKLKHVTHLIQVIHNQSIFIDEANIRPESPPPPITTLSNGFISGLTQVKKSKLVHSVQYKQIFLLKNCIPLEQPAHLHDE